MYQKQGEAPEAIKAAVTAAVRADEHLKVLMKKVMPFVATVQEEFAADGMSAFDVRTPFDEKETLERNVDYLKRVLELGEIIVQVATDEETKQKCSPGKPFILLN